MHVNNDKIKRWKLSLRIIVTFQFENFLKSVNALKEKLGLGNTNQTKITFSAIAHDWIFWTTFLITFTTLAKVLSICAISTTYVLREEREHFFWILLNDYKNGSVHYCFHFCISIFISTFLCFPRKYLPAQQTIIV